MLTIEPSKLSVEEFLVAAFWMQGAMRTAEIAAHVSWTPGQVRGFVYRSFNPARFKMNLEDRQAVLNTMEPFRNGHLELMVQAYDHIFKAVELEPEQIVNHATMNREPDFDLSTRAGRKQAKEWRDARRQFEANERRRREERERGWAPRPEHPDVLEWLRVSRKLAVGADRLNTSDERRARENQDSAIIWRHAAGDDFRKHYVGAQLTSLGAMDYEAASMGSKATGPALTLPEFRLFCIHWMNGVRTVLTRYDYDALEAVVVRDQIIWERDDFKPAMKRLCFDGVLHALDLVAFYKGDISREYFDTRWPDSKLPTDEEIRWPNRNRTRDGLERVKEWMEEARLQGAI